MRVARRVDDVSSTALRSFELAERLWSFQDASSEERRACGVWRARERRAKSAARFATPRPDLAGDRSKKF
jgi:hypothetical protein